MRVAAFLILALMVVANATVRSRLRPKASPFAAMKLVRLLKEPVFLSTCLASFMFMLGAFLPFNFIPSYAVREGMSLYLSEFLISILNATR